MGGSLGTAAEATDETKTEEERSVTTAKRSLILRRFDRGKRMKRGMLTEACTSKKRAIVALNIIEVGFFTFSKTKSYQLTFMCTHY